MDLHLLFRPYKVTIRGALKQPFYKRPKTSSRVSGTNVLQRTYIVGGNFRGGTTAIAKMFISSGIFMGENLSGNLEDPEFQFASPRLIRKLAAQRNQLHDLWGWKFPLSFEKLPRTLKHLRSPHVVLVYRDPYAVALSEHLRVGQNLCQMLFRTSKINQNMSKFYRNYHRETPIHLVSYEHLLTRTEETAAALFDFAGLNVDVQEISKTVKPAQDKKSYNY